MDRFTTPTMKLDPRLVMAQSLLRGGGSRTGHWSDGISNAADKIASALLMNSAKSDADANRLAQAQTSQSVMEALMGKPAETTTYGDGTEIAWNERAPSKDLAFALMGTNPDLAPAAMNMKLADMQAKEEADRTRAAKLWEWENQPRVLGEGQRLMQGGQVVAEGSPKRERPQTVNTAEGVFVLNPDGTLGNRLGGRAAADSGNYYIVPTGQGPLMVDKQGGVAQLLGTDDKGNLYPVGQPFRPMMDANRQPTAIPQTAPEQVAQGQTPVAQQDATPAAGANRPLLPPSSDPTVQGEVTKAKESAKMELERPKLFRKAQRTFTDLEQQWNTVRSAISQAKKMIGPFTTGMGSWLSAIPGTEAKDLQNVLNTIKANIGFDKLQSMRDNSPTGGALGQVSEFENRLLQAVRGSLEQDQSAAQLLQNLDMIEQDLGALRDDRFQAFQSDFGDLLGQQAAPAAAVPAAPAAPAQLSDDDILTSLGLK